MLLSSWLIALHRRLTTRTVCPRTRGQRSNHTAVPAMIERLEPRLLLAAAFPEFIDPNPNAGNQFGNDVVALSTGNVVITSPFDDNGGTDAGAVYLFNGSTGALISTLRGSHANDNVGFGRVIALGNGNYVFSSELWDNGAIVDAGAVTFGNGTTGVVGTVSAANSLVGTHSHGQKSANFQEPKRPGNAVDAANFPAPKHSLCRASPNVHRSKCIQRQEHIQLLRSVPEVEHTSLNSVHQRKLC